MKCHFLFKWHGKRKQLHLKKKKKHTLVAFFPPAFLNVLRLSQKEWSHISYLWSFKLFVSALYHFFCVASFSVGRPNCTLLPHLMDFGGKGKGNRGIVKGKSLGIAMDWDLPQQVAIFFLHISYWGIAAAYLAPKKSEFWEVFALHFLEAEQQLQYYYM